MADNDRNSYNKNNSKSSFVGKESPIDFTSSLEQLNNFKSNFTGAMRGLSDSIKRVSKEQAENIKAVNTSIDESLQKRKKEIDSYQKIIDKLKSITDINNNIEGSEEKQQQIRQKTLSQYDKIRNKQKDALSAYKDYESLKNKYKNLDSKSTAALAKIKSAEKSLYSAEERRNTLRQQYESTGLDGNGRKISLGSIEEADNLVEHLKSVLEDANKDFDESQNKHADRIDKASTLINRCLDSFANGIEKYIDKYEDTFTDIASRSGNYESRGDTNKLYRDLNKITRSSGLSGAVSIKDDMVPALQQALSQGFKDQEAIAKATADATSKIITPWLDTNTEAFNNMSANMTAQQMRAFKGQQLQLAESRSGNRLLQTGVINSLTSDLEPLLSSIDYNTAGDKMAEYEDAMTKLMDAGLSQSEAYRMAKKAAQIEGDQYTAVTSGSVMDKQIVLGMQSGMSAVDSLMSTINQHAGTMANTGNDLIASAYGNAMGSGDYFSIQTVGKSKQIAKGSSTYISDDSFRNSLGDSEKNESFYNRALKGINNLVTSSKFLSNIKENYIDAPVGTFIAQIPGGKLWFTAVRSLLRDLAIGQGATGKIFEKVTGKLGNFIKNSGGVGKAAKSFSKSAGSAVKSVAKHGASLLAKGSASGTALGAAGIVAGLAIGAHDAYKGVKKAGEWGTSKTSAGIAGFFTGTSGGINDLKSDDPEKKAAAKANIGKNAAKYGLIGAGIGTLVGGPVGTAIGGAVGAAAGAAMSLVDSKKLAQSLDKAGKTIKNGFEAGVESLKKVKNKVSSFFKELPSKLWDITKTLLSKAKDAILKGNIVSLIIDLIKNYKKDKSESKASGITYVPEDGRTYRLHEGEAVLTKNDNRILRAVSGVTGLTGIMRTARSVVSSMAVKNSMLSASSETNHEDIVQIITAMKDCSTVIVKAINDNNPYKNNIDRANNLLGPDRKTTISKENVNMEPTSPSASVLV